MKHFNIVTEKEFDIIYNTYRMKVINAFSRAKHMTATFKQIADSLGDNSSKVTYHGKMLIEIGLLTLDHTNVINGITAKYYRLITDSFTVNLGDKDNPVIQKKIMKGQADVVLASLSEMTKCVGNLENENRHLAFAMDDIHLTKEEYKELWASIEKLIEKKEPRPGTTKTTFYTLMIHNHDGSCSDKE